MIDKYICERAKKVAKEMDEMIFKFLRDNGYQVDDNATPDEVLKLNEELAKEDKQVRYETIFIPIYNEDKYGCDIYGTAFFDSVKKPLNKEKVEELLMRKYLEEKERDKEC